MNHTELENTILGQIILDPSEGNYALEKLDDSFFSSSKSRNMFNRMREIVKNNQEITVFTIGPQYEDQFIELSGDIVSTVGSRTHVDLLVEKVTKSRFILNAQKVLSQTPTTREMLLKLEPMINELASINGNGSLEHCEEISLRVAANLEKIHDGKVLGVRTGFPNLDDNDLSLRNGELAILGARPSVGKSALAWQIAVNSKSNVAFYSQEMNSEALLLRQLSRTTNLPTSELRKKTEAQKALYGLKEVSKLPIWIDDSQGKSGGDIFRSAKRFAAVRKLDLIVVDYLQLLNFSGSANRREGVGDCAATMKRIAKELNIPVICISSIKRGQDPKKAPTMEDLKESGDIEFHADVIFLMHRDLFNKGGETELIKAKDRNGEVIRTTLKFERRTTSFHEMTKEDHYNGFLPDQ